MMPDDETCNQVQLGKCLMSSSGNVYRLLIMYGAILIIIGLFYKIKDSDLIRITIGF